MMNWGSYRWGMGFGWINMIVFWVLIIDGIVYLVQAIYGRNKKTDTNEAPLDVLMK